jgi:hypothetical protein
MCAHCSLRVLLVCALLIDRDHATIHSSRVHLIVASYHVRDLLARATVVAAACIVHSG